VEFSDRQSCPEDRRGARRRLFLHFEAREETPGSALAVAQALVDAGLPKGVLSVVFGVPSEVSTHLLASPVIRAISFTGSIPVGKQLMKLAADGMKRTTMELGGHAPVLVFDDVEHRSGAGPVDRREVSQRWSGLCVTHPFYVQEKIYEKFVQGFTATCEETEGDGRSCRGRADGPLAHDRRAPRSRVCSPTRRKAARRPRPAVRAFPAKATFRADRDFRRAEFGTHHERGAVRPDRDPESLHALRGRDPAGEPSAVRACGLRVLESRRRP